MRAEGQAHIDRIEAALALVRRSLDWDRAVRRLDELNARVEDPSLWNNPRNAEEVMRERRRLEGSIGTVNEIANVVPSLRRPCTSRPLPMIFARPVAR